MDGSRRQDSEPHVYTGSKFDDTPLSIRVLSPEPFGRGGSARIFKGETLGDEPLAVAVKVFDVLGSIEKQLLERELRAVRTLSPCHKFILPFLGTVDYGDRKAIVSLYMHNGNLLEFIKAHPGCDKESLLVQVAEAVNYLHSTERLVHGDLKCANVLVSDSGEALLGDFGLSTCLETAQTNFTTTTGIRQMHTARFAAPELFFSGEDPHAKPLSKTYASDVYAYGMLVLEALTEKLPWPDSNDITVILQVLAGKRPPRPTSTGFSPFWWGICQRCWRQSPGDRPPMDKLLTMLMRGELELCLRLDPSYRLLKGHSGVVWSVTYMPFGRRVVSGSDDGSIRIWDPLTGYTVLGPLVASQHAVICVAVSPDGHQICSGSADRTIRRWDAESGAPICEPMIGHDIAVTGVAFSPDGTRIVSCSEDETVRLWDAATGKALGNPLLGHTDEVWSVAFSPDSTCIASGSRDGTIRLWDSATGASLGILHHDGWGVFSVCFSPDRIHLVSGDKRAIVRIWNVSTRQVERELKGHSHWVTSIAVSPSGGYIASGSDDKTICIWDAHTGEAVGKPLAGHTRDVYSVAFSPDGRSVVSGSYDRTVRIWDLFE